MSPDTRDPEVMFWLTVSSYPACCIFHLLAPLPAHPSNHLRTNHLTNHLTVPPSYPPPPLRPRWQRMPSSHVFYHRSPAHSNSYVLRLESESHHSAHLSWLWNPFSLFYWKSLFCSSDDLFSFAFCFDKENEVYQFAMCQPFTYSRHKVMISHIL